MGIMFNILLIVILSILVGFILGIIVLWQLLLIGFVELRDSNELVFKWNKQKEEYKR